MSDSQQPATPQTLSKETATGDWASRRESPTPDNLTVTSTELQAAESFDLPNPFGRYRIDRFLGRGGMGAVYKAYDSQLDRPVALKIPTFRAAPTPDQKERFLREARAVSALHHPNLCPVYDLGEEQGILFFTTAFLDGQPLSALLERGSLPVDQSIDWVRQIAGAMQVAHVHGTIHRDLKPANIMIAGGSLPVVMDFGLARRATWADESDGASPNPDPALTQFGAVLGTPAYMPPEQAQGDLAAIGPRSDIYSLGVILYELLSGRRPFAAEDTSALIRRIVDDAPPRLSEYYPWIEPAIENACLRALAKNPADRFPTMGEFERALQEAVDLRLKAVKLAAR